MVEEEVTLTPGEWVLAVCWLVALVAVPWAAVTWLSAEWAVGGFLVVAVGVPFWDEVLKRR